MKGKKLTLNDVKKVEKMLNAGMRNIDIADCLDISEKTVRRIKSGEHVLQQPPTAVKVKPDAEEPIFENIIGGIITPRMMLMMMRDAIDERLAEMEDDNEH